MKTSWNHLGGKLTSWKLRILGQICKDCAKLLQSCLTLCEPIDCSPKAPLSMGFSRQEYWSRLPCPSPGDLLVPGIGPTSLMSLALAVGSLPLVPPGKP